MAQQQPRSSGSTNSSSNGSNSQESSPASPPADVVLPTEIHDMGEEGSDVTRDIYVALFKDKERSTAKSMPDISEVLYEDVGACASGAVCA